MKLIPPEIKIEEFEGFTPENDVFQRREYAENLTNLISNVDDELVLALDAPWGEGKTTFVKMWRGMLKDKDIHSIYFDAFKNDFIEDPFLALVGEINDLLEKQPNKNITEDIRNDFRNKAVATLKAIGKASVRVGIRTATAGVLDETILEGVGVEGEATDIADQYFLSRITDIQQDKATLEQFQITLGKIAKGLGENAKLVFIIDELDRCKPSFALDLLEKIKHVFSIPNIVFVLVMNREQMSEVIKTRYGSGINATKYLQKFIHIWMGLPKKKEQGNNDGHKYLNHCLNNMDYNNTTNSQGLEREIFSELIDYYEMSFREIERSLTNFALVENTTGGLGGDYLVISVYLSVIKVLYPDTFRNIRLETITYNQVVAETNLANFTSQHWANIPESHILKWLLRYYISDKDDVQLMLKQGENYADRRDHGREAVRYISKILDSFRN
ncbi:MAG: KAP family NTPase [Candidatus Thiodiazotropha taylori]|nr:KAP family NTPase [Candidatus Thiodiazotropha taylori]